MEVFFVHFWGPPNKSPKATCQVYADVGAKSILGQKVHSSPPALRGKNHPYQKKRTNHQAIERVLNEKALAENVHAETMRQLELDRDGKVMLLGGCFKYFTFSPTWKDDPI